MTLTKSDGVKALRVHAHRVEPRHPNIRTLCGAHLGKPRTWEGDVDEITCALCLDMLDHDRTT